MLNKKQINSIKKAIREKDNRMPIVLGALGDQGRFNIFKILMKHKDICVTDIAAILRITISAASQQLRVLERIGLVRKERMGKMICYQMRDDYPIVKSLRKLFHKI